AECTAGLQREEALRNEREALEHQLYSVTQARERDSAERDQHIQGLVLQVDALKEDLAAEEASHMECMTQVSQRYDAREEERLAEQQEMHQQAMRELQATIEAESKRQREAAVAAAKRDTETAMQILHNAELGTLQSGLLQEKATLQQALDVLRRQAEREKAEYQGQISTLQTTNRDMVSGHAAETERLQRERETYLTLHATEMERLKAEYEHSLDTMAEEQVERERELRAQLEGEGEAGFGERWAARERLLRAELARSQEACHEAIVAQEAEMQRQLDTKDEALAEMMAQLETQAHDLTETRTQMEPVQKELQTVQAALMRQKGMTAEANRNARTQEDNLNKVRELVARESRAHKQEIARLNAERQTQVEAIQTDAEAAMETIRSQHETQLDAIRTEAEAAMDTLRSEHEAAIACLERNILIGRESWGPLEERCKELEDEVNDLDEAKAELETRLKEAQAQLTTLPLITKECNEERDRRVELEILLSDAETEIQERKAAIEAAESDLSSLVSALVVKDTPSALSAVTDLYKERETLAQRLAECLEEIERLRDTTCSDCKDFLRGKETLEEQILTLEEQVIHLQGTVQGLEGKVADAEHEREVTQDTLKEVIETTSATETTLRGDITALQERLALVMEAPIAAFVVHNKGRYPFSDWLQKCILPDPSKKRTVKTTCLVEKTSLDEEATAWLRRGLAYAPRVLKLQMRSTPIESEAAFEHVAGILQDMHQINTVYLNDVGLTDAMAQLLAQALRTSRVVTVDVCDNRALSADSIVSIADSMCQVFRNIRAPLVNGQPGQKKPLTLRIGQRAAFPSLTQEWVEGLGERGVVVDFDDDDE
ncbi:hypothetical protein KIPB_006993, partial [Kipferlia bialata]